MAIMKGAFLNLGSGLLGVLPNVIVFQFNPVRVTRTPILAPPKQPDGGGNVPALPKPDRPTESMSFTLQLDATDQLAKGSPIAASNGILPTLSALELLMVPKKSAARDLQNLAGGSSTYVLPPDQLDAVLFFWGSFRILPVILTSLSITETEYTQQLLPIRAEVSVSLQVLVPNQIAGKTLAEGAYAYSQTVKEAMAALNLANAAEIGVSASVSLPF